MLAKTLVILGLLGLTVAAVQAADDVDADYLAGTWSLDGASACGKPGFEHVVIDRDGAFRNYRGGRLQAAGLWHLGEDYIEIHVISSAALFNPELEDYVGYFSVAQIDALETKVERNHLEVAVKSGDRMDHWQLDRCKK